MECAGRGLAFWSYQSTQEMYVESWHCHLYSLMGCSIYQEYMVKAMTEKHNTLNIQIDKILNDANSELNILSQKLNSMIRCRLRISFTNSK